MKKIERKYYNKTKTEYYLALGTDLIGKYDLKDEPICAVIERQLDFIKIKEQGLIKLVRFFRRKGVCLAYKITDNNICLLEPEVYLIPTSKPMDYVDLWRDLLN